MFQSAQRRKSALVEQAGESSGKASPENQGIAASVDSNCQQDGGTAKKKIGRKLSIRSRVDVNPQKHPSNATTPGGGSHYSSIKKCNAAAEESIFGPLAGHLEAHNPNLKGLWQSSRQDQGTGSQAGITAACSGPLGNNPAKRPSAAAENKRQQRTEMKIQEHPRDSNQQDLMPRRDSEVNPTQFQTYQDVADEYGMNNLRISPFEPAEAEQRKAEILVNQAKMLRAGNGEARRALPVEHARGSIQLGCASLNSDTASGANRAS